MSPPFPLPPHPLPGFFPSRNQTVEDSLTQGVFVWTVWMQSSATSVCIILLPFAEFSCRGVWMPWSLQLESWFPFFSFVKFLDCSLYLLWFARSQKMCNQEVGKCNIQHSEHQKECCFLWQFLLTKLFFIKSSGMAPRVDKCPAPGQHKVCKCPTPGTDKAGKCPAVAWKVGWVQLELTDVLDAANCTFWKLLMNNQ